MSCFYNFFKDHVEEDVIEDFCKLFSYLKHPNKLTSIDEATKLMEKIIKMNLAREEKVKFENKMVSVILESSPQEELVSNNNNNNNNNNIETYNDSFKEENCNKGLREIIIMFKFQDVYFVPKKLRIFKNLQDIMSLFGLEKNYLIIFDERIIDTNVMDKQHNKKGFNTLNIGIQTFLTILKKKKLDLLDAFISYKEFYNFVIRQFESLNKLEKIVNIIFF